MSKNKPTQVPKKKEVSIVRSSAAEYLTFAAAGGQSETSDIFPDNEPEETAVIRQYLTTAALGEQ